MARCELATSTERVEREPLGRRRMLPRGRRDLVQQLAIWIVLGLAYEAVRGTAGHDRAQAFRDGRAG